MPTRPDAMKRALRRLFVARKQETGSLSSVPTPRSPAGLRRLVDEVRANPFDAGSCYELALAFLLRGIDDDGVRYLDRSFRLDPVNIVRFVLARELHEIRQRPGVVSLLTAIRRDRERRSYAAYA